MTIISKDEDRKIEALHDAENMFWATIAAAYPEAKTGDLSPLTAIALTEEMHKAVTEWLEFNADEEPPEAGKVAEVMLHRIEYFYRDKPDLTLTDSDKEHVAHCISQGIREGELCTVPDGKLFEVYGYWNINNNPDA